MSEYAIIQKSTLDTIGNLIRSAYNENKLYTPQEMATKIAPIFNYAERNMIQHVERTFDSNLILPEGPSRIYGRAFAYSPSLTSVVLPKSLKSVSDKAFDSCANLTTVTFMGQPSSYIGNAFSNCPNLTSINVPWASGKVSGAPWGATNATVNYNYTGIDNSIGTDTRGNESYDVLVTKETLEALASTIRQYTIDSKSLTALQFPGEISKVFFGDMSEYNKLLENIKPCNIVLPTGVTAIADYAFHYNPCLVSLALPEGVVRIGNNAFQKCDYMESINFPEGLESIGSNAFNYCEILGRSLPNNTVVLPASLTEIQEKAFSNCYCISTVTFKGTPNTIHNTAFQSSGALKTINVPWAEGEVAGAPWGATSATINYNYTG